MSHREWLSRLDRPEYGVASSKSNASNLWRLSRRSFHQSRSTSDGRPGGFRRASGSGLWTDRQSPILFRRYRPLSRAPAILMSPVPRCDPSCLSTKPPTRQHRPSVPDADRTRRLRSLRSAAYRGIDSRVPIRNRGRRLFQDHQDADQPRPLRVVLPRWGCRKRPGRPGVRFSFAGR